MHLKRILTLIMTRLRHEDNNIDAHKSILNHMYCLDMCIYIVDERRREVIHKFNSSETLLIPLLVKIHFMMVSVFINSTTNNRITIANMLATTKELHRQNEILQDNVYDK